MYLLLIIGGLTAAGIWQAQKTLTQAKAAALHARALAQARYPKCDVMGVRGAGGGWYIVRLLCDDGAVQDVRINAADDA